MKALKSLSDNYLVISIYADNCTRAHRSNPIFYDDFIIGSFLSNLFNDAQNFLIVKLSLDKSLNFQKQS